MKRPFASLSPQEALHVAISIEERNQNIYRTFADMFEEFGDEESQDIAAVFRDMAAEETRHASLLRGRYGERYGNTPCIVTDDDLHDFIEVPRLENGDFFSADLRQVDARNRALTVALHAEIAAQAFYRNLAQTTSDEDCRQLYLELAEMEDGHVTYIEGKLAGQMAGNRRFSS